MPAQLPPLTNAPPSDPLGGAWLAQAFKLPWPEDLPVVSRMGGRRATQVTANGWLETWPEAARPSADVVSHLLFHLRHEVPHLGLLARLFEQIGPDVIQTWVDTEPTGQYARRAAFLYEWLTGKMLSVPEGLAGNYVDALDGTRRVVASTGRGQRVPRWRVVDNLPGTRHFCPLVVKTEAVKSAESLDVHQLLDGLMAEFGPDLLRRSAVWLTLRESRASFSIEGEGHQVSRVQRFADVMARRLGQGPVPLSADVLAELQQEILGRRTSLGQFGLRQSPVFVGETVRYQDIVHYVAPPAADVAAMLEGLRVFLDRTQGQSAVMRSAVVAFGFVYIHPLADGNGRVHRFLINDILRRDGAVPDSMILPVSSLIADDAQVRRRYDQVLDGVSRPLMSLVREHVDFARKPIVYPDGVSSNFCFSGDALARPLWRYPDLGPHVCFLADVLGKTLATKMREESRYLQLHARARAALKEVVEMPDAQADRVIRSLQQNEGALSNVLAREIPILAEPGVWAEVVEAVSAAWQGDADPS